MRRLSRKPDNIKTEVLGEVAYLPAIVEREMRRVYLLYLDAARKHSDSTLKKLMRKANATFDLKKRETVDQMIGGQTLSSGTP
jgi:hypothetical protein